MSGTRLSGQTSIVGGIALEQAYKKIINIKDNDAVCSGADPDGNWLLHSGPPPPLYCLRRLVVLWYYFPASGLGEGAFMGEPRLWFVCYDQFGLCPGRA